MKKSILDKSYTKNQVSILMVDDHPENLLALEAVLSGLGYRLVRANSGEEALKYILTGEDFALILLDVQMPGLNGFETAKLIKARERSKHIPIIFITAISQATEHVVHGYNVGGIDYIFKPFNPETLKMKIESFVKIYENNQILKKQSELLQQRTLELEESNHKLQRLSAELGKSEALAKAIAHTSLDTILVMNDTGCIRSVNPAVKCMLGFEPDEIVGKNVDFLFNKHMIGEMAENEATSSFNSTF